MKSFFLKVMLFTFLTLSLNACKKKENHPSKSKSETKEKSQSNMYSQEELEVAKHELEGSLLKVFRETNKKIREEEFGAKQLAYKWKTSVVLTGKRKLTKKLLRKLEYQQKSMDLKTKVGISEIQ